MGVLARGRASHQWTNEDVLGSARALTIASVQFMCVRLGHLPCVFVPFYL